MERGMLSGSTWAWISITPLKSDCACAVHANKLEQKLIQMIRSIARRHDFECISFSLSLISGVVGQPLDGFEVAVWVPHPCDFQQGWDLWFFL
jgi:hypothetical protein